MQTILKQKQTSFTEGPLFMPILQFSFPLMLGNILQLLYNAADTVVVGQFGSTQSLAAVGSTTSIVALAVNLFVGLSVGVSVMVAQQIGAKREKDISETVHTAMMVSALIGTLLMIVGVIMAKQLLLWMDTPTDVLAPGKLYIQIYFIGMPASMVYNFGSAAMRAAGDSKRPLYYLSISGLVNVLLNLLFVIVFRMDVAGVALASAISQFLSAVFVVRAMLCTKDCYRMSLKKLRIHRDKLIEMIRLGLPAGIQNTLSSVGNIMIQSSVNTFGAAAMAGKTVASSIETFVFNAIIAFSNAALTFTGQNVGAKQFDRIGKITRICLSLVMIVGIGMAAVIYYFRMSLFRIYTSDAIVMEYASERMGVIITTYFLAGIMNVMCSQLRAMGMSLTPMIVSSVGLCVFPIFWIFTVFQQYHTLQVLYMSYPVSWVLTTLVHTVCYFAVFRRLVRKHQTETEYST